MAVEIFGDDVLRLWRDKPIPPGLLPEYFLNKRREARLNVPSIEDVRRAVQLAKRKVLIDKPPRAKTVERHLLSEMKRGAFVHIDSAHMPRGVGAKFVLVAVCAYSHAVYFEGMKRLGGSNAALALGRIAARFLEGPIKIVYSDRGTRSVSQI